MATTASERGRGARRTSRLARRGIEDSASGASTCQPTHAASMRATDDRPGRQAPLKRAAERTERTHLVRDALSCRHVAVGTALAVRLVDLALSLRLYLLAVLEVAPPASARCGHESGVSVPPLTARSLAAAVVGREMRRGERAATHRPSPRGTRRAPAHPTCRGRTGGSRGSPGRGRRG